MSESGEKEDTSIFLLSSSEASSCTADSWPPKGRGIEQVAAGPTVATAEAASPRALRDVMSRLRISEKSRSLQLYQVNENLSYLKKNIYKYLDCHLIIIR